MNVSNLANHEALEMNLHYVSATEEGYRRDFKNGKYIFSSTKGKVEDAAILARIEALAIPPAWRDVWICKHKNGHIQATGIDKLGRKQYRYHQKWCSQRNLKKFDRLIDFSKKLKLLRRKVRKDLRLKKLSKDKVCASAIDLMSMTHIRAGNKRYEAEYGSFGLTTLKNRHIKINSDKIFFKFKGKKGVLQQIYLKEAKVARLLKRIKEIPGQELFQYYDEKGNIQRLDSGDMNAYIRDSMQDDFSCKDFRTWAGCNLALTLMTTLPYEDTSSARKKILLEILDSVADSLGNTRSVTRNYYVHPELQAQYLSGQICPLLSRLRKKLSISSNNLSIEKVLQQFLETLKTKV